MSHPAPRRLAPIERRIVGTLLEKMLSTPQSYPLSLNSLVLGCNQKNNREPEMSLVEGDVVRALEGLLEKGLVLLVRSEGSRTDKWRTSAREPFALANEKAMALFSELLVRGPQTLSELRRNSSRMRHELGDEDVRGILAEFAGRETPLVVSLGKAPGGRAERWSHTLYDEAELAQLRSGSIPPAIAGAAGLAAPPAAPSRGGGDGAGGGATSSVWGPGAGGGAIAASPAVHETSRPAAAPADAGAARERTALEARLAVAMEEIEAHEERLAGAESELEELRSRLAGALAEVEALRSRMAALDRTVVALAQAFGGAAGGFQGDSGRDTR